MPVKKGLIKLYDAKASMMTAIRRRMEVADTGYANLWLAVIEQAVFDAHLHSTGGNYPSVVWVAEARGYFETAHFVGVCDLLEVEPDWVRKLANSVRDLAVEMRGSEYYAAAVLKPID